MRIQRHNSEVLKVMNGNLDIQNSRNEQDFLNSQGLLNEQSLAVSSVVESDLLVPVQISAAVFQTKQTVNSPIDYQTVRQAAVILRKLLLEESVMSAQAQANLSPQKVALLLED